MNEKDNIKKELKELAPELSKRKAANPYSVPESYFTDFNATLIDQINSNEDTQKSSYFQELINSLKSIFLAKPQYAYAYAFLAVLVIAVAGIKFTGEQNAVLSFQDISDNEILAYVSEYSYDFDEYLISEYLEDSEGLNILLQEENLNELETESLILEDLDYSLIQEYL